MTRFQSGVIEIWSTIAAPRGHRISSRDRNVRETQRSQSPSVLECSMTIDSPPTAHPFEFNHPRPQHVGTNASVTPTSVYDGCTVDAKSDGSQTFLYRSHCFTASAKAGIPLQSGRVLLLLDLDHTLMCSNFCGYDTTAPQCSNCHRYMPTTTSVVGTMPTAPATATNMKSMTNTTTLATTVTSHGACTSMIASTSTSSSTNTSTNTSAYTIDEIVHSATSSVAAVDAIVDVVSSHCTCLEEPLEMFHACGITCFVRPYARHMLRTLRPHMDIMIYTSATQQYAMEVASHLGMANFCAIISRGQRGMNNFKDVCRATSHLQHVVIVDNDWNTVGLHRHNAIVVNDFDCWSEEGCRLVAMYELKYLTTFLEQLGGVMSLLTTTENSTFPMTQTVDYATIRIESETQLVHIVNQVRDVRKYVLAWPYRYSKIQADVASDTPWTWKNPCPWWNKRFNLKSIWMDQWHAIHARNRLDDVRIYIPPLQH